MWRTGLGENTVTWKTCESMTITFFSIEDKIWSREREIEKEVEGLRTGTYMAVHQKVFLVYKREEP